MDIVDYWIIAAVLVCATAILGYGGGRALGATRAVSPGGASADRGRLDDDLVVDSSGAIRLSEKARRMINAPDRSFASLADFAEKARATEFTAAISALLAKGGCEDIVVAAPFEKHLLAAGRVEGLVARFAISDCTTPVRRALAAERALAAAEAEAAQLRCAMRRAGVSAWIRAEEEATAWQEISESRNKWAVRVELSTFIP